MVRVCCVEGCVASKKRGVELKYFKFPKSKTVKKAWLKVVKSTVKLTSNTLVCSSHFHEADYTVVNGRKTLKKSSVPSVHVGGEPKTNDKNTKASGSNDEDDSDTETSSSDKDDVVGKSNDPEMILPNSNYTNDAEMILPNDAELTEMLLRIDTSCGENDENNSDKNDVTTEILRVESRVNSKSCETIDGKDKDVHAEDGVERNDVVSRRRNSGSEPCQAETNGCEPFDDPLSGLNGVIEASSPHLDTDNSPKSTHPVSKLVQAPSDPEKAASDPVKATSDPARNLEKALSDTERALSDIEKLLDLEQPPTVLEKPPDREKLVPDEPVLDPKTGLLGSRKDSIESIEDSCDSLGESTEEGLRMAEPVFVEISVDPDNVASPSPPDSPNDCMMIVENVQVDVDPNMLLMMEHGDENETRAADGNRDDEEVQVLEKKPEEPVSLLTSSDEDDVVIQEPHIDCVSVSDETDEDDQPLTRLLKDARKKKAQVKKVTDILERRLKDIFWGKSNEYYCYMCAFSTKSKSALALHAKKHAPGAKSPSISFYVCNVCSFQTPSASQFSRHKRKHREDKKFQCHLCEYKARHKMSLVYHVRSTHLDEVAKKTEARVSGVKIAEIRKSRKKKKRRRPRDDDDEDDEYVPGAEV